MTLVFAIMHLYNIFRFFYCFCPFLFYNFFLNPVLIIRRNSPRYQRVLALCAFLTGLIPKGLIFENFVFDVCVCFVLCKFVSGLILWFMDNLWFDDLRAE